MGKKASYKGKKQYKVYESEGRFSKNKLRKLRKQVKENPNDTLAQDALNRLGRGAQYTRKAPNNKVWNTSKMNFAQALKKSGLNGHIALIDAGKYPDQFRKALGLSQPEEIKPETKRKKRKK